MFKTNEGTIDRALRVIAGLALLAMFFIFPDASCLPSVLALVVPLATGLLLGVGGVSMLGLSTCPVKRA